MRTPKLSLQTHRVFLLLFAFGVFSLMMLPVLLVGYPHSLPDLPKYARIFLETGQIVDTRQHMLVIITALMERFIAWDNINAWVAVSTAVFCLSFFPLWWSIRMLFDKSVAWISVVVFAMMPISWAAAPSMSGYCFALLPLFLSFGCFIKFHTTRPLLAVVLSSVFFGLTVGIQHSYLAFLPWFTVAYLWQERRHLLPALVRAGVFCVVAYGMFLLPMFPSALQEGLTPMERVEVVLSPMTQTTPGEGHLYPDEFIFEHYKEEYDAEMEENVAERSFIKNQEDRNYRIIFGVGRFTIFDRMATGLWMFLNSIPDFFMMDFTGGVFLWLFILPGIAVAWRTRRTLVLSIAGLILSMEFFLRFVLLFTSAHLDNYVWALSMFAGVGGATVAAAMAKSWKGKGAKQALIAGFIAAIIGLQMLQTNRKVLAPLYSRSRTPEVYAATEALKTVPLDAVVATPRRHDLFKLSPHAYVSVHPKTMEFLSARGKLAEPFALYGVTHIIGYTAEQERAIKRVAPDVRVVELSPVPMEQSLTPFIRYLLQTIR